MNSCVKGKKEGNPSVDVVLVWSKVYTGEVRTVGLH